MRHFQKKLETIFPKLKVQLGNLSKYSGLLDLKYCPGEEALAPENTWTGRWWEGECRLCLLCLGKTPRATAGFCIYSADPSHSTAVYAAVIYNEEHRSESSRCHLGPSPATGIQRALGSQNASHSWSVISSVFVQITSSMYWKTA